MKHHEYANLFPMLQDAELQSLAADIKENGLQSLITVFEDQILDGRNRFRACEIAGVIPAFESYAGEDALAFVISHNLHRRHLTESQRAMVAAKMADLKKGANQHPPIGGAKKYTRKESASALNVGHGSVDRAKQVLTKGIPEIQDMVTSGEISVNTAKDISTLPEDDQRKAVSGGVAGVKDLAKKLRQSAKQSNPSTEKQDTPQASPSTPPHTGHIPKWKPDDADRLWLLAKQDLNKILPTDKSRVRVLNQIISYAQTRIETKQ